MVSSPLVDCKTVFYRLKLSRRKRHMTLQEENLHLCINWSLKMGRLWMFASRSLPRVLASPSELWGHGWKDVNPTTIGVMTRMVETTIHIDLGRVSRCLWRANRPDSYKQTELDQIWVRLVFQLTQGYHPIGCIGILQWVCMWGYVNKNSNDSKTLRSYFLKQP